MSLGSDARPLTADQKEMLASLVADSDRSIIAQHRSGQIVDSMQLLPVLDRALRTAEKRLSGAMRVVEAARAIYDNDDVWTKPDTDGGHRRRDKALGDALRSLDVSSDSCMRH